MSKVRYALLVTVSFSCNSAFAQTADPVLAPASKAPSASSTDDNAGEIIVTAQKRSERLSEVPLSITVATGEQLTNQGINSPAALQKIVPGLTYVDSPYGQPLYTVRGIGSYDEALGGTPTVAIYVDQVPLPYSAMTEGASLDVAQVEVLKGPQGTLFGQNTTGGAINYIAAKPTSDFQAGGNFSYGNYNAVSAEGYVTGAVTPGLNVRLAAKLERRDGWQHSYTRTDRLNDRDFLAGRLLADWDASDDLKFGLNINGWRNRSQMNGFQFLSYSPQNPNGYTTAPGYPNFAQDLANYPKPPAADQTAADWDPGRNYKRGDSMYQISLRGDWKIGGRTTVTSISAYSHADISRPVDNDGTALPNQYSIMIGKLKTFSQELRLAGSVGESEELKWLLGGNYGYDKTGQVDITPVFNSSNSGVGPLRWDSLLFRNDQRVRTGAIFGSLDFGLTDKITLQGSVRYTKSTRWGDGCAADTGNGSFANVFAALSEALSGGPTAVIPGACYTLNDEPTVFPEATAFKPLLDGVRRTQREDSLSFRAGVSWKPATGRLLYANVTRGYKAGEFGLLPLITSSQYVPVRQERLTAYEAGFKTSLFNRTLDASGALFYYDYSGKQQLSYINVQFFGALLALVNVPKSRVKGAELSLAWKPLEGLSLRASATYINTRVKSHFLTSNPLGQPVDIAGESFPTTPSWQTTSDAEYEFPISTSTTVFVGALLTYRNETNSSFGKLQQFVIPGYALLDLRAGVQSEDGRYRVQVWGRNVTNKYYRIFTTRPSDTITTQAGMPATYGITLSVKI